jgi:hypothetical protein
VVAGGITWGLGAALTEANARALEEFLNTGKMPDWSIIFLLHLLLMQLKKW